LTEPSIRPVDVRVGSSTDGLAPISVAERPLRARLPDWLALAAVVAAAVGADQLTKRVVSGTLALGESKHVVGPSSSTTFRTPGSRSGSSRARRRS
jgi:hypothetical protein